VRRGAQLRNNQSSLPAHATPTSWNKVRGIAFRCRPFILHRDSDALTETDNGAARNRADAARSLELSESLSAPFKRIVTVRQRLLWLLLLGLVVAILVLIARHGAGTVGPLTTDEFGSLAYKLAILVFLAAALFAIFRDRLTEAIMGALLWAVIGIVLVIGYSYRYEVNQVADRVIAELMPGHVISHGRSAEVARTGSGDFAISALINGARVHMVVDTGATSVVLTAEDAKAAGLPLALLNYTVNIETANGRARAAPVTLDRISMGELEERSVEALVVQPGQLRTSLLGMSFLNRLQSWQVNGDRLVLKGYP
jgi:aspartyl protease family protein